jgi:hypothetical protein
LAFTHACTASPGLYGLDDGTFSTFNGDGNICQLFYYLSQYLNDPKKFLFILENVHNLKGILSLVTCVYFFALPARSCESFNFPAYLS